MPLPKVLAFAALAVLALAACGGSPTPPTGVPNVTPTLASQATPTLASDATPTLASVATPSAPITGAVEVCSLLTPADLKAATGDDYLAGTSGLPDLSDCNWRTAEGDIISAYIQASPLGFNFHKDNTPSGGVDLTVAGHPAFYNRFAENAVSSTLWVDLGGGREFSVWYIESQAIAVQLAEIALGRM